MYHVEYRFFTVEIFFSGVNCTGGTRSMNCKVKCEKDERVSNSNPSDERVHALPGTTRESFRLY
jgi:hypothetical protein